MQPTYFFLVIIFFIIFSGSVKILRDHERVAVLRLGQFVRVGGPGLVFLIPFVDKGEKINLNKDIPNWQALSKLELDEKIKSIVLNKPMN